MFLYTETQAAERQTAHRPKFNLSSLHLGGKLGPGVADLQSNLSILENENNPMGVSAEP